MKQGGRSLPEKKRKTVFDAVFLYESIKRRHYFFWGVNMLENHSIVRLNAEFFERHKEHIEILNKPARPHLVLVVQIDSLTFAIPFRTSAHRPKHGKLSHCFFFSTSGRRNLSKEGKIPALDFSKAVIVTERDIGMPAIIDHAEFIELRDNMKRVEEKFKAFLRYYVECNKTGTNLDKPMIMYSSLQYFKEEILSMNFDG